jgi:hypothetical protein
MSLLHGAEACVKSLSLFAVQQEEQCGRAEIAARKEAHLRECRRFWISSFPFPKEELNHERFSLRNGLLGHGATREFEDPRLKVLGWTEFKAQLSAFTFHVVMSNRLLLLQR